MNDWPFTDSRQALGLNEAITRGIAFKNAGADAVFIEAPESKEEMREIAKHVKGHLVANMLERGVGYLYVLMPMRL